MHILVHQAEFNNGPVHLSIGHIKGQIIPIEEGVFRSIINTQTKSWKVIETKEKIMDLIKEARHNG